MKFINPKIHGVIDYLAVAFLFMAPSLFGFTGTDAATLAYVAGAAQLGLSLLTAYPLGVIRRIPFPIHGMIELTFAIGLIASPWIMGFDAFETVRNVFVISGLSVVAVFTFTNYRAALSAEERRHDIFEHKDYRKAA